ncbi:UNVERIFIED_CONTAM: hypothetical protein ABID98_004761 [Brevibacillus sp. OAP136]
MAHKLHLDGLWDFLSVGAKIEQQMRETDRNSREQ